MGLRPRSRLERCTNALLAVVPMMWLAAVVAPHIRPLRGLFVATPLPAPVVGLSPPVASDRSLIPREPLRCEAYSDWVTRPDGLPPFPRAARCGPIQLQCRTVSVEGLATHQECGVGSWRCVVLETIQDTFRRGRSRDGNGYVFACPHTIDLSDGASGDSAAPARAGMVFPPPLLFVRVAWPPRVRPALPPQVTSVVAGVLALLTFAWLRRARALVARELRRPDAAATPYRRRATEGVGDASEGDLRRAQVRVMVVVVVASVASVVAIVGW